MEGDESFRRTCFDGSKRLREDNRRLRQENQRLLQIIGNASSSSSSSSAAAAAAAPSLAANANANAELERKNEMLSKQAELLMHELDEAHNAVRHRDQCLESYGMQATEFERTVASLVADKQSAEESFNQHQEKLRHQKNTIEKLSSELKAATLATRTLEADIEAKSLQIKELEEERSFLLNKLESASKRNDDLQAILGAKSEEVNGITFDLDERDKSLQVAKTEAAERATALVELKQCLSQTKQEGEIAKKETKKCRGELDVALASYDKVEMVCNLLKDQVESLTQERLTDAESIREMAQLVESLKVQHAAEILKRQECIDELTVTNANTSSLNERILREKNDLEKQYLRQQRAQEEERSQIKTTIQQSLTDRISLSESKLDKQSKENRIMSQSQSNMAHRIRSLEKELETERHNLLQQRKRADASSKELRSSRHEYEEEASKHERQITKMKKDLEINEHQRRCDNADREAEIMSLHQRLEEEASKYQQLVQTKNKLHRDQEAKLSQEREVCHRLLERNREVNENLNALSAKNMDLSQIVEEQNDKMESLGLALEDAQNKLTGINGDLSRALADQEERIGKEKEMRRELRKVQAELDHLRKFGDDSTER